MKLQLIRNATMKISYSHQIFLTDPMLGKKDSIRSFAGIAKNPTIDLPLSTDDLLKDIDFILLSHTHPDHLDEAAIQILSKDLPFLIQPCDLDLLRNQGFTHIYSVENALTYQGIELIRTYGQHGSGEILKRMGTVCGYILKSSNEPTIYWAGDTIACKEIFQTIEKYHPDYVITHSGGAQIPGYDPIIMNAEQTIALLKDFSWIKVFAVHLEALDHCMETRSSLRQKANESGINSDRLIIPQDGQWISL